MPVRPTTTDGIKQVHETYITPPAVVKAHVDYADLQLSDPNNPKFILDPCAGTGNYGAYLRQKYPTAVIIGVDTQSKKRLQTIFDDVADNYKTLENWKCYDAFYYEQSIFDYKLGNNEYFDLIITNPPFSLTEGLVAYLWNYLDYKGVISFLNRIELLESQGRFDGLFKRYPLRSVGVSVNRIPWLNHPAGQKNKGDYRMYAFYNWVYGYEKYTFETKLISWSNDGTE